MKNKDKLIKKSFRNVLVFGMFLITVIAVLATIIILFIISNDSISPLRLNGIFYNPKFITALVIIVAIITAIAYAFTYYQLLPLKKFGEAMKKVADGDFSIRISKSRKAPNEINELSESFNIMTNELENTELLKHNFINDFSHEFKTPISSINGLAKILLKNNLPEEQKHEYLSLIVSESERLALLSKNVLLLNKVECQDILTDLTKINLTNQIRKVVLSLQNTWNKKDIEFELELEEISLTANEALLSQVWLNLIENAVKFSPNNSSVYIDLHKEDDKAVFTITNYGTTIPAELFPKIFDKFFQANESRSTKGNGIGLSIAKKVCDLHNAEISVASDELNGTTFTVKINI